MQKNFKKEQHIKNNGTSERCNMCVMGIPKEKKPDGAEDILEATMAENFPKLMTASPCLPLQIASASGAGVCQLANNNNRKCLG